MAKKKVVSIEDRIPKLKEARKKKTNRRLIFYISLFFILISIVVYLQSPLSKVKHVNVKGNTYIKTEEIISLSNVTEDTNIWSISTKEIETRVLSHQEMKDVKVSRELPTTIQIEVEELEKVAYVKSENQYAALLENGKTLEDIPNLSWRSDAPLLLNFDKDVYVEEIATELALLPTSISSLISEIHRTPTESNPYKVKVWMNDGYEVETTIHRFASYLKTYPTIVSQLEKDQQGVITIGDGGAVFDPYEKEQNEKEGEEEKNETEG